MKNLFPLYIRYITSILIISFFIQNIQSQEINFWSKVRYGGNIGLGFSNDTFNAIVAPSAVYDYTDQLSFGAGINFGYTNGLNFSSTNYGVSLISLYRPFPQLEFSVDFEQMGVSRSFEVNGPSINQQYWYPALFLGIGYRVGGISMGIRYDILYNESKSIYVNAYAPFVRVFF